MSLIPNGPGSRTPGPCTLIAADIAGVASMPGPSFTSVTRISCMGRCAVPANRSVDSTLTIRICPWLHGHGRPVTPGATRPSRYCPFHGDPVVRPGTGTAPAARPGQRPAAPVPARDRTPRRDQGRQAPARGAAALVPRVRARAGGVPRPGAGVLRPAAVRGVPGQPRRFGDQSGGARLPRGHQGWARGATGAPKPRTAAPAPRLIADFRSGVPDLASFPRGDWMRAMREACQSVATADLDYGDPRGSAALREVLAAYLRRVRAAAAIGEDLVVCTGFAQ